MYNRHRGKFHDLCLWVIACFALVGCSPSTDAPPDIGSLLDSAENYRTQGQYRASIIELRKAMQAQPDDHRSRIALARLLIELGQAREASKVLAAFDDTSPEYYLLAAEAYLKTGKLRSAFEVLDGHEGALDAYHERVNLLRGDLELARGNFDAANEHFNQILASDPSNTEALLGTARVSASQSDLDGAASAVDQAIQAEPSNPKALLLASWLKSSKGDLEGSEALLMQAVVSTPRSDLITPLRYSVLASLRDNLSAQGKTSEAMIYAGMLTEMMEGAQETNDQYQAAMDALTSSDMERARNLLAQVQSRAPNLAQAGAMLGVIDYLRGDADAAARQFEQYVDPEIASPRMLQMIALTELRLNRPHRVLDRLADEIEETRDARLVSLYGLASAATGKQQDAEMYLTRAIELDPDDARLHLPLAELYNVQERPEEALAQIRKAFDTEGSDPMVQAALVRQLILMERFAEAEDLIGTLRSRYGASQGSQLLVAEYYRARGDVDSALESLKQVLALGESKEARGQIAAIHLMRGDYALAESELRTIVALSPENRDAYKGLITIYELQDRVEEGIAAITALGEEHHAAAPLLVLSEYYGRKGDFEQAFAVLDKVDSTQVDAVQGLWTSLHILQADGQIRSGAFDESRRTIQTALGAAPQNPALLALLVRAEIAANRLPEADRALDQLRSAAPETPIVHLLAGDVAARKKDFATALAQYRLAWERAPSDQVATKIAIVLERLEGDHHEEILAFFDEWQRLMPRSQLALGARAEHYMRKGDLGAAESEYERLIEVNPEIATAHNNLAWIYGDSDIDKALAASKRAYDLSPDSAEIVDTYGWFLYRSGNVKLAREILSRAVELAPDNAEIRDHLDEALKD